MEITEEFDELEQASRSSRLIASMLDGLIMMVAWVPSAYLLGMFETIDSGLEPTLTQLSVSAFIGIAFYFLVNWRLLSSNAQTIGKRLNNIKVVNLEGEKPSMSDLLLKRYLPFFGLGYIPFIGNIASTLNLLWIFGKDRRCLHDLIAKTKVVQG